jgi:hypothetical protein
MPVLILLYWLLCLVFLIDNDVYKSYYYTLEKIDTIFVSVSFIHAFFYWNDYKKIEKYSVRAIITLVVVTFFYPYINKDFYYFLYFFVFVSTILESIRANINER